MSNGFWTDERKEKARRLYESGRSAREIADIVGAVSRNAVIGVLSRMRSSQAMENRPSDSEPPHSRRHASAWSNMDREEKLAVIRDGIAAGLSSVSIAARLGVASSQTICSYANKYGMRFTPPPVAKERRRLGASSMAAKMAARKEKPRHEPREVRQAPPSPIASRMVSLLDIQARECLWIDGDPKGVHGYCGHPAKDGSSYCAWHHRVCYYAVSDRRADLAAKHASAA